MSAILTLFFYTINIPGGPEYENNIKTILILGTDFPVHVPFKTLLRHKQTETMLSSNQNTLSFIYQTSLFKCSMRI